MSTTAERTWTHDEFFPPKDAWGEGPWQDEPDKVQWVDEETGYDCLVVRNRMGALCGYVGVPEGHPYHGKHYDECPDEVHHAHGGLTFANRCADAETELSETDMARVVCHVPLPGRPHDVWWFGFDCSHAGDYSPSMGATMRSLPPSIFSRPGTVDPLWYDAPYDHKAALRSRMTRGFLGADTYKTLEYVRGECASLAKTLQGLA